MPGVVSAIHEGSTGQRSRRRAGRGIKVADCAAVARRLGLTRARLTQLTKLVLLAPEIQERLLLGETVASERALRAVVCEPAWGRQTQVASPA